MPTLRQLDDRFGWALRLLVFCAALYLVSAVLVDVMNHWPVEESTAVPADSLPCLR